MKLSTAQNYTIVMNKLRPRRFEVSQLHGQTSTYAPVYGVLDKETGLLLLAKWESREVLQEVINAGHKAEKQAKDWSLI